VGSAQCRAAAQGRYAGTKTVQAPLGCPLLLHLYKHAGVSSWSTTLKPRATLPPAAACRPTSGRRWTPPAGAFLPKLLLRGGSAMTGACCCLCCTAWWTWCWLTIRGSRRRRSRYGAGLGWRQCQRQRWGRELARTAPVRLCARAAIARCWKASSMTSSCVPLPPSALLLPAAGRPATAAASGL
jgi:hypothetical protein